MRSCFKPFHEFNRYSLPTIFFFHEYPFYLCIFIIISFKTRTTHRHIFIIRNYNIMDII